MFVRKHYFSNNSSQKLYSKMTILFRNRTFNIDSFSVYYNLHVYNFQEEDNEIASGLRGDLSVNRDKKLRTVLVRIFETIPAMCTPQATYQRYPDQNIFFVVFHHFQAILFCPSTDHYGNMIAF